MLGNDGNINPMWLNDFMPSAIRTLLMDSLRPSVSVSDQFRSEDLVRRLEQLYLYLEEHVDTPYVSDAVEMLKDDVENAQRAADLSGQALKV